MPSALKCRRCGGVLSRPVSADERPLLCFDCQAAIARVDAARTERIRARERLVAIWIDRFILPPNRHFDDAIEAANALIAALGLPDPD